MFIKAFVRLMNPRWIVGTSENNKYELGIRVFGINLWYYKWPEPMLADDAEDYCFRIADKREFGEVILSKRYLFNARPLVNHPPLERTTNVRTRKDSRFTKE